MGLRPLFIVLAGLLVASPAGARDTRPDFSQRSLNFEQDAQDQLSTLARLTRHYYLGKPIRSFEEDAWAMAQGFAALGLHQSAEDHYRRAAALGDDTEKQNRAWLALARSMQRRGAHQEALDTTLRLADPVSEAHLDEAEFLRAQARMALGNYAEAALGLENWKSPGRRDFYTRYNLGVALIKVGRLKEGSGMLEQLGIMQAESPEELALRDRANVVLGYSFLHAEHGATAKPVFQRVRLQGPSSDKALLGAGWAELVPPGRAQEHISYLPIGCVDDPLLAFGGNDTFTAVLRRPARDPCDRNATFKARRDFEKSARRATPEQRMKRALVPWVELLQRDPRREAVQEALVAAPYVMVKLGAYDQATSAYRLGISQLEGERRRLDDMLGRMAIADLPHTSEASPPDVTVDSLLRRWGLHTGDERLYLSPVIAGNGFREDIERYNQLLLLQRKLRELQAGIDEERTRPVETTADVRRVERAVDLADRREVMLIRVGRGLDSQSSVLKDTVIQHLESRRERLDSYLSQARFSLARLYDQPPQEAAVALEDIPPEPEEPGILSLRRWLDRDEDTSDQGNALTGEAPNSQTYADKEEDRGLFDIRGWFERDPEAAEQPPTEGTE